MATRLPLIPAGTAVHIVNADTGWVVARSATVVDDTLLWGQTLIEFGLQYGDVRAARVAVDRTWVLIGAHNG